MRTYKTELKEFVERLNEHNKQKQEKQENYAEVLVEEILNETS